MIGSFQQSGTTFVKAKVSVYQCNVSDERRVGVGRWGRVARLSLDFLVKRFVPGSLVGIKDIDFVGRSEAETP